MVHFIILVGNLVIHIINLQEVVILPQTNVMMQGLGIYEPKPLRHSVLSGVQVQNI